MSFFKFSVNEPQSEFWLHSWQHRVALVMLVYLVIACDFGKHVCCFKSLQVDWLTESGVIIAKTRKHTGDTIVCREIRG